MFSAWQQEKATASLVDAAQAVADKLATAKPHIAEYQAAAAQYWQASFLADGQDLHGIKTWKPAEIARFVADAQTRITALRKQRAYDSSDGLAIWLHTARAVTEPRIAPVAREIWAHLMNAGPNADGMAEEQISDAGLPPGQGRRAPAGFGGER